MDRKPRPAIGVEGRWRPDIEADNPKALLEKVRGNASTNTGGGAGYDCHLPSPVRESTRSLAIVASMLYGR
jgi:hypothetical protein